MQYLEMISRLAISLWAGGNAIFTLVMTPILFKTESRDIAGRIVGNLFPGYFRWGLACGAVALICRVAARGFGQKLPLVVLILMLMLTSFQAFYVEPRAASLKQRIGSFETTSREDPLRKEFARLHGVSAACNLTVLAGGILLVLLP
jgi:hypothetical protein